MSTSLASTSNKLWAIKGKGEPFSLSNIVSIVPINKIVVVDKNGYIGFDITSYFSDTSSSYSYAILDNSANYSSSGLGQVTFNVIPTYEYLLLQNFVTGHEIGSPDLNNGLSWAKTIQSDSWYDDNWMGYETYGGNLLSSTVGDVAIDTSSPLDFSKYEISNGTPFGVISCNGDDTSTRVAFSIQNLEAFPITIETFACGRPRYEGNDYVDISGVVPVFTIGKYASTNPFTPKPNLSFCVYPDGGYAGEDSVIFVKADIGLAYDESTDGQELIGIPYWNPHVSNSMHKWLAQWHHYALTIDNDNMYMFVDGSLKGTISLSTQLNFSYTDSSFARVQYNKTLREFLSEIDMSLVYAKNASNSEGYSFDARFAQFAVCQECKWTSDFTVPTEAY
jgi:hypothetical protein